MYEQSVEIEAGKAVSLITVAALVAQYTPGFRPFLLRAAAIIFTTATTVATGVADVRHRPTCGSAAGETTLGTFTYTTAQGVLGNVAYLKFATPKLFLPGSQMNFQVTTGVTAGAGNLMLFFDPSPEEPANNTKMFLAG